MKLAVTLTALLILTPLTVVRADTFDVGAFADGVGVPVLVASDVPIAGANVTVGNDRIRMTRHDDYSFKTVLQLDRGTAHVLRVTYSVLCNSEGCETRTLSGIVAVPAAVNQSAVFVTALQDPTVRRLLDAAILNATRPLESELASLEVLVHNATRAASRANDTATLAFRAALLSGEAAIQARNASYDASANASVAAATTGSLSATVGEFRQESANNAVATSRNIETALQESETRLQEEADRVAAGVEAKLNLTFWFVVGLCALVATANLIYVLRDRPRRRPAPVHGGAGGHGGGGPPAMPPPVDYSAVFGPSPAPTPPPAPAQAASPPPTPVPVQAPPPANGHNPVAQTKPAPSAGTNAAAPFAELEQPRRPPRARRETSDAWLQGVPDLLRRYPALNEKQARALLAHEAVKRQETTKRAAAKAAGFSSPSLIDYHRNGALEAMRLEGDSGVMTSYG